MKRVFKPFPPLPGELELIAEMLGVNMAKATELLDLQNSVCQFWEGDNYQVKVLPTKQGYTQLLIRRKDGGKVVDHYQTLQHIKNTVLGEDWEAVELFPAISREYDTSNTYHLWASRVPFPVGYPAGPNIKKRLAG